MVCFLRCFRVRGTGCFRDLVILQTTMHTDPCLPAPTRHRVSPLAQYNITDYTLPFTGTTRCGSRATRIATLLCKPTIIRKTFYFQTSPSLRSCRNSDSIATMVCSTLCLSSTTTQSSDKHVIKILKSLVHCAVRSDIHEQHHDRAGRLAVLAHSAVRIRRHNPELARGRHG